MIAFAAPPFESAPAPVEDHNFVLDARQRQVDVKALLQAQQPSLSAFAGFITDRCGRYSIHPHIAILLIAAANIQAPHIESEREATLSPQAGQIDALLRAAHADFYGARSADGASGAQPSPNRKSVGIRAVAQRLAGSARVAEGGDAFATFNADYARRFGAPTVREIGDVGKSAPVDFLRFPWNGADQNWSFGGVHSNNGSNANPRSSIDFYVRGSGEWSANPNEPPLHEVRAAHGGVVTVFSACNIRVTHGSGWATNYYHLENPLVATGDTIAQGTPIAFYANDEASALCQGGASDGPHVHFTLLQAGAEVALDQTVLSGWTVEAAAVTLDYETDCELMRLSRGGERVCPFGAIPASELGVCGSASGQSFSALSETSPGLCSLGTVRNFSGTGPWFWDCSGALCSARIGADTTPAAFTFTAQSGLAPGALATSNTVTISGITATTPVSVAGGTYSVNGGPFTATAGAVVDGNTVAVRVTTALSFNTAISATLDIGGVTGRFTATTRADDVPPDTAMTACPRNSTLSTASFAFTGTDNVGVAGFECSVNGAGFIGCSSPKVVSGLTPGAQAFAVRAFDSAGNRDATPALCAWTVDAVDTTPDAFAFVSVGAQALSIAVVSNAVTIFGINTPASISISGGEYRINGGGFTAASGMIENGGRVELRVTTSALFNTSVIATVSVGGVSSSFTATTGAAPVVTVNGQCGTSHQIAQTLAPNSGFCAAGIASVLSGEGPWTWRCAGTGGGTTASCATQKMDSPVDSDLDGIPDWVEIAEGRAIGARDNAIFSAMHPSSTRWFAMQQYRDFLNREAEPAGLTDWTNYLNAGTFNREQVIQNFFNSPEFQQGVPPIVRLYLGYFNRIPDHDGLFGWVAALRKGIALDAISSGFAASAEFQLTYGALSDSDFVTLVYKNVLNRLPDETGFNGWLARLRGGLSRGSLMLGFTESEEYQAQTRSNVFVIMMYEGMLRRASEPAGYQGWVDYLNAGRSALDLTRGFVNSQEYRNRFLAE